MPEEVEEVPDDARPDEQSDDTNDTEAHEAAFRVRCPDCGPQHVAISDLRLVETESAAGAANRYVFACPECGSRVRRPAGPELSEVLRASGVATLALHRGPGAS
jgi:predicted RNA-binding Zn-ribbon protein involved in translation (DUF1610 family)